MTTDRRTPFNVVDEKTTLLDFLDYLRDGVALKATGVDDADLRRPMVASGTSLMGLVKHLTFVETTWVQWSFAGDDVPFPSQRVRDDDTGAAVVDAYRAAVRRSNEIIAAHDDLDARCARSPIDTEPLSLRWVLVHVLEETARHAGHADILREQLDGSTGR